MHTIELALDDETMERVQRAAVERQCSVEQLLKEMIDRMGPRESFDDPLLGMMADDPELVDDIVRSAMEAREKATLREASHG